MAGRPEEASTAVEQILVQIAVPGHEHVYVVGGRVQRVTIASQQYRAFNEVHALVESGRLLKGARVAVVGGGRRLVATAEFPMIITGLRSGGYVAPACSSNIRSPGKATHGGRCRRQTS